MLLSSAISPGSNTLRRHDVAFQIKFGNEAPPTEGFSSSGVVPKVPVDTTPLKQSLTTLDGFKEKTLKKEIQSGDGLIRFVRTAVLGALAFFSWGTYQQSAQNLQSYYETVPQGEKAREESRMSEHRRQVLDRVSQLKNNAYKLHSNMEKAYPYSAKVSAIHSFMQHQDQIRNVFKGVIYDLLHSKDPADVNLRRKLDQAIGDDERDIYRQNPKVLAALKDVITLVRANEKGSLIDPVRDFVRSYPAFAELGDVEKDNLSAGILSVALQGESLSNPEANHAYWYADSFENRLKGEETPEGKLYSLLEYYTGEYFKYPKDFQDRNFSSFLYCDITLMRDPSEYSKFFESLITHPDNFKDFTAEERAHLLQLSKDIVKAVDYPFHQMPDSRFFMEQEYGMFFGFWGMIAGLGSLGILESLRLIQALRRKNGKNQTLHILEREGDKEQILKLENEIRLTCNELTWRRMVAIEKDPEVKAFFVELYGLELVESMSQGKVSPLDLMARQMTFQVYQELLPDEHNQTIDAVALHQKILEKTRLAVKEKNYLPEAFLLEHPVVAQESLPETASEVDKLIAEIRNTERMRTYTYCRLMNQLILKALVSRNISFQEEELTAHTAKCAAVPEDTELQQSLILEKRKLQTERTLLEAEDKKIAELRTSLKQLEEQKLALNLLLLDLKEIDKLQAGQGGEALPPLRVVSPDSKLMGDIQLKLDAQKVLKTL